MGIDPPTIFRELGLYILKANLIVIEEVIDDEKLEHIILAGIAACLLPKAILH